MLWKKYQEIATHSNRKNEKRKIKEKFSIEKPATFLLLLSTYSANLEIMMELQNEYKKKTTIRMTFIFKRYWSRTNYLRFHVLHRFNNKSILLYSFVTSTYFFWNEMKMPTKSREKKKRKKLFLHWKLSILLSIANIKCGTRKRK